MLIVNVLFLRFSKKESKIVHVLVMLILKVENMKNIENVRK